MLKLVTPKKELIVERATELFFQNEWQNGNKTSINPTLKELSESGYLAEAQTILMESEQRRYEQYTHNNTLDVKDLIFDIELAKKRGTFISGNRGSGKSNLGKILVDKLLRQGYIVKVFDNSQTWRHSSVPNLRIVKNNFGDIDFTKSCVFDLSMLYIKDQRRFVEYVVKTEFELQTQLPENQRQWMFYVFEECEMLVSTHNRSEEILRLACTGRNFKMSYIVLAQRLAMVSPSLISLCGQLHIGQAHEENDLKKLRNWLGNYVSELRDLTIGEFLYKHGKYAEKIQTDKFTSNIKPKQISETRKFAIPEARTNNNKDGLYSLISTILLIAMILCILPK